MRSQALQMTPEVRKRLLRSRVEAETLQERELRCPGCGFRLQTIYSREQ